MKKFLLLLFVPALIYMGFILVSAEKNPLPADNKNYEAQWKKVDSLQNKGLYRMALTEVNNIFKIASIEKAHNQVIKAVLYELRFNTYLEEDDYILGIHKLNEMIKDAPSPSKEILHSLTAEVYWGYYNANRWKFAQRTNVVEVKLEDIRTWDLERIAEKVVHHYSASLLNAETSRSEPIKDFEPILNNAGYSNELRPTLYDFLAFRAFEFFQGNSFNVGGNVNTFSLIHPEYFSANSNFIKIKPNKVDSLNTKFWALRAIQELTKFRTAEKDITSLIHVELSRLKFIRNNSVVENAEELYYQALKRMTNNYPTNDDVAEVWYSIAEYHSNLSSTYHFKRDTAHRWEKKKALEICLSTIEKYPGSFGAKQCQALADQIRYKELSMQLEEVETPNSVGKFRINYKNIDKAYMKIVKVENSKYWKGNFRTEALTKYILSREPVQEKELELTNPGDYLSHATEVDFEGLENGYYYVILSSSSQYKTSSEAFIYAPFWVTDLMYQTRAKNGTNELFVASRTTGKPVPGAKVKITYEKYNYKLRVYDVKTLGTYITDANGMVNFDYTGDYYGYYAEIKTNKDFYEPRNSNSGYYYGSSIPNHEQVNLFTDRKIYRPGQTIYFKGIAIHYKGKERDIITDREFKVYFKDVNGQIVEEKTLKTNEFGSFEGTFTVPFGVLTGQMTLQTDYGTTYFRVEEYKRPKFFGKMDPIKGEFKLGDKISATGFAEAYAGNKIDGAIVKYRVTRNASYYNRWWWGWYPPTKPKEVISGETVTDENGKFTVDFEAIADETLNKNYLPMFTYTVYADITDINGETHTTSTGITIGYQSLMLNNNLSSEIENNSEFELRVYTTNLSGEDVPAKGNITIHKLLQPDKVLYSRPWEEVDMKSWSADEYAKLFPQEVYEDEDKYQTWKKGKKVLKYNFDTPKEDSIIIYDFKDWEPGVYKYEAVSTDKNGFEIRDERFFTVYNREAKNIPTNETFWARLLKYSCEPGEKAQVLFGTAEEELYVKIEVEHEEEIVDSKILNLKNEQIIFEHNVIEAYRGGFTIHILAIKNKHYFNQSIYVSVPYTNKRLDLNFETFRDKLKPGEAEEWIISIRNAKDGKEQAELLATLYDQSLDALYTPNQFYMSIYASHYARRAWQYPTGLGLSYAYNNTYYWNSGASYPYRYFPTLNYHGYSTYYYGPNYWYRSYNYEYDDHGGEGDVLETVAVTGSGSKGRKNKDAAKSTNSIFGSDSSVLYDMDMEASEDAPASEIMEEQSNSRTDNTAVLGGNVSTNQQGNAVDLSNIEARTNFNETAFFYPQLTTDADGNVKVKFTIPESLTKWQFLGLAHTKDLKIGTISEQVVTQKELMVVPNVPRFFREGDKITVSTKISNISEGDLNGNAQLFLIDPFTEEPIDAKFKLKDAQKTFSAEKGKSTTVSWELDIPYMVSAVKYKIVASGGKHTDGEENVLPILSNRMLVTESLPLPIRGKESKEFTFEKLVNSGKSNTLRHHRYTLEFTSNPAWYALQAMPYMMEYPHECAEQTFTRFYSNTIAAHIMNSNPKIKKVIEDWGQNSPEAFLSNLQKNQELKAVMLEETPWVLNAKSEEQTKRNLSILLDMERMSREMDKALGKVIKAQSANGGWPWFPGMKESRYITQHIITGMGHLDHLGIKDVKEKRKIWNCVKKGVRYLDGELLSDYNWIMRYASSPEDQHIGYTQIQYLYARSYFPEIGMNKKEAEAVDYFKGQAKKYWLNFNIYAEGMIALAAHRFEMKDLATDIVKSLKDRSIHKEEFGMYWKDYYVGYYWYEAPIETQALMIEMFDEVTNDQESVEGLKIWLLKEKQTTHWKTTKQTTEAVYALLLKGTDLLASDELVQISLGGKEIKYVQEESENPYEVKSEAGTGYFKTHWEGSAVVPKMGNITVTKSNTGVAWGAAYWQYFEDLDKITFAETNLKLNKKLYLVEVTPEGEKLKPVNDNNVVHVGDKLRVRIELNTDRNLEYVHMKDMRGAGFEPTTVLSRYRYQDGLGYYQATKDAATHFFFDFVPKGVYVFEYDLRVSHVGDFSNGITTVQCMYAPEFTSHSKGIRVIVE